jgi:hypothetical protein
VGDGDEHHPPGDRNRAPGLSEACVIGGSRCDGRHIEGFITPLYRMRAELFATPSLCQGLVISVMRQPIDAGPRHRSRSINSARAPSRRGHQVGRSYGRAGSVPETIDNALTPEVLSRSVVGLCTRSRSAKPAPKAARNMFAASRLVESDVAKENNQTVKPATAPIGTRDRDALIAPNSFRMRCCGTRVAR